MVSLVRIENRGQLIYMLSEAAELEHGIMCCYLYCAFSMKRDVAEGVTEEQLKSIQGWRKTIMEIAVKEMLHMCLACTFSRRWAALLICAGPIFLQAPGPTPHPSDWRWPRSAANPWRRSCTSKGRWIWWRLTRTRPGYRRIHSRQGSAIFSPALATTGAKANCISG